MPDRGALPTFEAPHEPGQRTAVLLQHFDTAHERVQLGAHGHRDLELLYFQRGSGRHSVSGHTWDVRARDVVLIPPGQIHDLGGISDDTAGWALEFSAHGVRALGAGEQPLLLWRANPLLNPFVVAEADPEIGRFRVPEADVGRWESRLAELDRELRETPPGHGHAAAALLLLILVDLARLAADVPTAMRARDEPTLASAFDVIERRFDKKLTLRDVADEIGLTPGYLTTFSREKTGRTIQEWILERRLAEARSLLLGTDLTVEAIAFRVGFDDAAYFNRRFRQVHGMAPGAWREAAGV